MTLYLIRHAQSYNNALDDPAGRMCDPPLTDLGRRQAACVAEHIRAARESGGTREPFDFTRLICSPMIRALQTASAIGQATGVPVEVWTDVHETLGIWRDSGDGTPRGYPGVRRSRVLEEFPGTRLPDDVTDDGWWNRPVETESQWRERAKRVAARIRSELLPARKPAAFIVHGGFVVEMLCELMFDRRPTGFSFDSGNTSVTRLGVEPEGRIRVNYLNRLDHLPEDLLS